MRMGDGSSASQSDGEVVLRPDFETSADANALIESTMSDPFPHTDTVDRTATSFVRTIASSSYPTGSRPETVIGLLLVQRLSDLTASYATEQVLRHHTTR